jgi:hypothetical protein
VSRGLRGLLLWGALPLVLALLASCGGGDGRDGGASGASSADLDYLFQHNARFNDGLTVRWANLPIRVFTNGIAREDEVTEWTRATGGAVTFTFVGSASGANITFRFGTGDDICGTTTIRFTSEGEIVSSDVQLVRAIFRTAVCTRTVVHEVGHAIGFLDHTTDGGLMDDDGGDGRITEPVASMLTLLYSMAPGSVIRALAPGGVAQRRAGAIRSVTVVDPARR